MKKIFKDNIKKIIALLLVVSMTTSFDFSVFAQDYAIYDPIEQDEIFIEEDTIEDNTIEENTIEEECIDETEEVASGSISKEDEEAREKECMPDSPVFLNKFLTYLSLKYPEIGINPSLGTGGDNTQNPADDLYNWYNATKMKRQKAYDTIEIDGNDTFAGHSGLTKNMVQFKYLGNFGGSIGNDDYGKEVYSDTVKTLIIRNVDEIRNLYVPASIETLIIENTTFNCYYYYQDSPGFQCGMMPGDLKFCKNLKKLVLKNVKFGDNYKKGDAANRLPAITYDCPYETNYVLNLQNCHNLEELEIDVSFVGAREVQLAIDGGTENLFSNLTKEKCKINPAPGTGYGQVILYANESSKLANFYDFSETVKFKNPQFRSWLLEAIGVDSNNDGVISQEEMDAIKTLEINDRTAHYASQTSLRAFHELADIGQMHGLKTLEIDFYDPTSYPEKGNRHPLEGIDFPDSLENLSMKNVYWEKNTETKSHENADIILTNLKTLELYNTDVKVEEGDSHFNHSTRIKLTDTEGVLQSCIIERTDVESIELINNSNGKGIKDQDEKQRIRFCASDCQNLERIEFLGEGYAIEGSIDLTNDKNLTHIGVPVSIEGNTQWTVYGEFDMTYAPVNVTLNSCTNLSSLVIDYDFALEDFRNLFVQAMDTRFSDDNELIINRNPSEMAGIVYLSCDKDSWLYTKYTEERTDENDNKYRVNKKGFSIVQRSSFPTIAVFSNGQRIRTSGEGNHNSDSKYTEDTDRWVDRWDLVMQPGGYSTNFGNLTFYVVDEVDNGTGNTTKSLRKVFYGGEGEPVYVEWKQQNDTDSIITLPTSPDGKGYKLTGSKLLSTGTPGEVELKLYVYKNEDGHEVKSYIGYQNIKIFKMPDSVDLVNDGTKRGSGTKDDPYIVYKNDELKLKARLLANGQVDTSGDYALRDVYWRIKEYDETPKYTSDFDGYSLYTLDSATKAGISVVRDPSKLEMKQSEEDYDREIDSSGYNHRRFNFDTEGSKFKIVAQIPYKNNDTVITKEAYVEYRDKLLSIDVSNDIIQGKTGYDETTITINNVYNSSSVNVSIKNPESYDDCFTINRDPSSAGGKEVWKLRINNSDIVKVKNIIKSNNGKIALIIKADGNEYEETIGLSSVYPETGKFWCSEIEDQVYTGKAIKPKLDIYYGDFLLEEGKDYTLSYSNNVKVASKTAVNAQGKHIGPSVTINGKGNYADKQVYYFAINPCSIENAAEVDDVFVSKTYKDIKIAPTVVMDGKKLKQGRDYVVSTTTDEKDAIVSLKEPKEYPLFVVGKGNYTGTIPFNFTITASVLAGKTKIQKIANQNYDGTPIEPSVAITYNGKDVTDCFDAKYENNIEIGTATVILTAKKTSTGEAFTGKAGYSFAGKKKATFKIVGTSIASAKLGVNGKDKIEPATYSGEKYEPNLNVYVGTTPLKNNVDYTVAYTNSINAGKATAVIKGKGKYSGTKKFTYKINKYDAGKDTSKIIVVNNGDAISVSYEKGGVVPKPTISMNGVVLTEKKDYTIKYANNKAVAKTDNVNSSGKSIAPTMIVTFKGNFSGKKQVNFEIINKNISEGKITLADKAHSTEANDWKQTVATIVDTNGKKLTAGVDYNKTFEYYNNPECTSTITEETLAANSMVYVKVTGMNNYEGSYIVGSYRISKTNISTTKAVIADKAYTGTPICPSAEDITVTVGPLNKTSLTAGVDYEVVAGSYVNNINKGTASVTIRGIGDYYGTKVVKYRICVNKILWWTW